MPTTLAVAPRSAPIPERPPRTYMYAETVFVPDRLPEGVRELLAGIREPIGGVLASRGVAMTRTVLGAAKRRPVPAGDEPKRSAAAPLPACQRSRFDARCAPPGSC